MFKLNSLNIDYYFNNEWINNNLKFNISCFKILVGFDG